MPLDFGFLAVSSLVVHLSCIVFSWPIDGDFPMLQLPSRPNIGFFPNK